MTSRLQSYLPALVLERLARLKRPERVGAEHRFGAVALFADISGFTSMSEALSATGKGGSEEMTELLNDYFGRMVSIVDRSGGSVVGFGGDALTAVFPNRGAPPRRAVRRAVRCANEMQQQMDRYQAIRTSAGDFSLAFKAGLAAGQVLLTTIGVRGLRLEPVIAGTAIDGCVAAEHHASPGRIVLHPSIAPEVAGVRASSLPDGFAIVDSVPDRRWQVTSAVDRLDAAAVAVSTLRGYLHPSVAEAIESGHGRHLNEHRRVTAIFTAFDGPDPSIRGAGPQLQGMLAPALESIAEAGGHLLQVDTGDKGDAFIVLFGAPVAHDDDEHRALMLALRLRDLLPEARIGICCGAMFCGEVGGDERRTYTAIGDPMNVAARLMQEADHGTTLIASMSDVAVRATVRTTSVGDLNVKGRSLPVDAMSIDGPSVRAEVAASGERLIGRQVERRRLRRRLDAALLGRGRAVVLTGPAGIGKSYLTDHVISNASRLGFSVHRDWCHSTTTDTPYAAIRGLITSLLGLEEPSPQQVHLALARLDARLPLRAPLLAPVLGVEIAETDATRGVAGELRIELLDGLMRDIARQRVERGPLLLCVEDCHWLDPYSRRLLGTLAESLSDAAALLLLTARTGHDPLESSELTAIPHRETVALAPLDERESSRLARTLLRRAYGPAHGSESLVNWLVERAGGNPFVLEESVRLIRDRGIPPDHLDPATAAELPVTIRQLVLARLDELPVSHRSLVLEASVLGAEFEPSWLWGSFGDAGDQATVRHRLADLRRLGLLESSRRGSRRTTRFRHATIQEAAYETLSLAHRRDLHLQVGRYLEQTYRQGLEIRAEQLAHHYGETHDIAKQRTYFAMAADKARRSFLNDAAGKWLRRLEPIVEAEHRSAVLRDIGELEQLVGSWASAESYFLLSRSLAEETGDQLEAARSTCALGHLKTYIGQAHEARNLLESTIGPLSQSGDMPWLTRTLEYLAFLTAQSSDLDASLAHSREHLAVAERTGDRISACMAIEQTGLAMWHRGDYVEATEALRRALRESKSAGYIRGIVLTANDLAGLWVERSDHLRAFRYVQQALSAARTMGYRHATAVLIGNAGELYRLHGESQRALCYAAAGLGITAQLHDWPDVTAKLINMATALADARRTAEAMRSIRLADAFAVATRDPYLGCEATLVMARICLSDGRHRRAAELVESSRRTANEIGRRDVHVASTILGLELGGRRGRDALAAIAALRRHPAPVEESMVLDVASWELGLDEHARRRATRTLQRLVSRAPAAENRRRLESIAGIVTPDPAPLPPLEGSDPPAPKLAPIFRDAQRLLVQVEATSG